jgi:hypothetical protein
LLSERFLDNFSSLVASMRDFDEHDFVSLCALAHDRWFYKRFGGLREYIATGQWGAYGVVL